MDSGSTPERLPEPVNSAGAGVVSAARRRRLALLRLRPARGRSGRPTSGAPAGRAEASGPSSNLGTALNTAGDEYEPLPDARRRATDRHGRRRPVGIEARRRMSGPSA